MIGDQEIHNVGHAPLCGVYYGVVTQNDDPDGRVKVQFPWMPNGDSDQSQWAYIAAPMAGKEYGTYVLPEVNDTVAVVFIAGDIRFPVILGGTWNKVDKPPETNDDGKNNFRFVKSRSGHRLLFDDSDKVQVALADKTNAHMVGCGDFGGGGRITLAVPNGINGSPKEGVAFASLDGDLNIHCPKGKLTISGMNVEVTAAEKLSVKAKGALSLESSAPAKVCASQGGKFQGSKVKVG